MDQTGKDLEDSKLCALLYNPMLPIDNQYVRNGFLGIF